MSKELKLFYLALVNLHNGKFDEDTSRELVRQAFKFLTKEEKELIHLSCNADVCEIIW